MNIDLCEQLRLAWEASGLTLAELGRLLQKANKGSRVSPPSLSRKLRGEQVMTLAECQGIARVLGVSLKWSGKVAS